MTENGEFEIKYYFYTTKQVVMSIFGIVLFLLIGGMAFWMLLFLMGFVLPFWISLGIAQKMRPKRVFEKEEETEK